MSPVEFRGKKHVVLYFYPRNNAPYPELAGCTREACSFRDINRNLHDLGAQVVGVSRQTTEEQRSFSEANGINFPLLSDVEGRLGGALGVPEIRAGKEVLWKRVTFLADKQGIIRRIFPDVAVDGHAGEVLAALLDLNRRG